MTHRVRDLAPLFLGLIVVLFWLSDSRTLAHTLGIDRGDPIDTTEGSYTLISRAPESFANRISTPLLSEHCILGGNPKGERGLYQVRYRFTCDQRFNDENTILLPWKRDGVMLTVSWVDADPVTRFSRKAGDTISISLSDYLAGSRSFVTAASKYTQLGTEHILSGVDHLLFIFGLLLLVGGGWALVKTITAFTIAHSIALGLAIFSFVQTPSGPVEAAIASSVVFLAVEIVRNARGVVGLSKRYPWIVAFGFGPLHGLGFSSALSGIGLPPNEIPLALFFFNIGVEIGQLAFVAAIWLLVWCIRCIAAPLPRGAMLVPAYAI